MVKKFRKSRKHFLDWVERPDFTEQLTCLLRPTNATVDKARDVWIPKGHNDYSEARLQHLEKEFGPKLQIDWNKIWEWWLVDRYIPKMRIPRNTPNWDLASTCMVRGQKGLVLVEGKAHVDEFKKGDKCGASKSNYTQIGKALDKTGQALGINISKEMRCTHFQLANRVAFSWKIASMGTPVILVYLGFLGDKESSNPFKDDSHWRRQLRKYMGEYIPRDFTEHWIDCGESQMQMIIRSLPTE